MKRLVLISCLLSVGTSSALAGADVRSSAIPVGAPGAHPAIADDAHGKSTIAYLKKLQTNLGGFLAREPAPNIRLAPTLAATLQARRALYLHGADMPNKEECVKFVMSCRDKASGGFSDMAGGQPSVGATVNGLMLLHELGQSNDNVLKSGVLYLEKNAKTLEEIRVTAAALEQTGAKSAKTPDWVKEIRMAQKPDGSIGDRPATQAVETGGMVAALARFGEDVKERDPIVKLLQMSQIGGAFQDGSHPQIYPSLDPSYRIMRCLFLLRAKPTDVKGMQDFIAMCRHEDGGYGDAPSEPSTVGGTYHAAIIRYWLSQD